MLAENHEAASENGAEITNEEDPQESAEGYKIHAQQIAGSVLGTNQGMIYNGFGLKDLVQFLNDMGIAFTPQKDGLSTEATPTANFMDARKRQAAAIVGNELRDAALVNEAISDGFIDTTDAAAMPDDIDEWYYTLDAYERCYVIASAMLQGAPVDEVSQRARMLCQMDQEDGQFVDASPVANRGIAGRSASKLRRRTYTTVSQVGGTPRLFWQNTAFGRCSILLRKSR